MTCCLFIDSNHSILNFVSIWNICHLSHHLFFQGKTAFQIECQLIPGIYNDVHYKFFK
ncbi:hypothetical protein LEQ41_03575 [Streptococcus agalactiae]|nr:hypothetical protein [Streptococcus agalactiae]